MIAHGQNLSIQLTVYNPLKQSSPLFNKSFSSWAALFVCLENDFSVYLSHNIKERLTSNHSIGKLTFLTHAWLPAISERGEGKRLRRCKFVIEVIESK